VVGFLDDGDGLLTENEVNVWIEYADKGLWKIFLPPGVDRNSRPIAFRIFASAQNLNAVSLADNLYQSVGLKMRIEH
jgi:hypothetical protein